MNKQSSLKLWMFAIICILIGILSFKAFGRPDFQPVFRPVLEIGKSSGAIVIDGDLSDQGWMNAKKINSFVERNPGENILPLVETIVSITHDADYLYVAFKCKDDPNSIRATMCQRDQYGADDAVSLLLDTYGTASWAYIFNVNPYGIQKDKLWSSISGEDLGFDLVWKSAAKITDDGYQVEMAIPFSSLRFPNSDIQKWKIDFWRIHPREVYHQYSWAAYDKNEQCFPCQWGTVEGISNVESGKGFEILPAIVANQTGQLTDVSNPNSSFSNKKIKGELSVGAKYSVTSDITAEASYNPDFSQIEADAQQIDVNSTIALRYAERRPFFQEGSDIFQTMFNSFYTRMINDPQYAAKVTGRTEGNSLGYVVARDENSPYIFPLDERSITINSGKSLVNVIRGLHTFSDASKIGVLISDRRFENGGYGTVLSLDGTLRLGQSYGVNGQYIRTYTKEPNNPTLTKRFGGITFADGKHTLGFDGEYFSGDAFITNIRRNSRNWNFYVDYNQIEPAYRTETGYDPVVNHRTVSGNTRYNFYPEQTVISRIAPYIGGFERWNFDGQKKIENYFAGCNGDLKFAQTNFNVGYGGGSEVFNNSKFDGLWTMQFTVNSQLTDAIGVGGSYMFGRSIAYFAMRRGNEKLVNLSVSVKPIDRLTIDGEVDFAKSNNSETGEEYYNGYIARTRIQLQVSKEFSFRLLTQYNNFNEGWDIDPLLTYRLSSFSVLYVGSTFDFLKFPESPMYESQWKVSSRQYFMKLQYLFQI
ncbi:MAG: carbohydrate binding family 9 domain-containing protein [Ignavibacteriales bacterium]|nr:carbohydrate binding family 9 domain-containing protein [Ignavibacteriales bacterium]